MEGILIARGISGEYEKTPRVLQMTIYKIPGISQSYVGIAELVWQQSPVLPNLS